MVKTLNRLVWIVFILPAIYLAITWKQIPEKVVMQFDLEGNPSRYGSKSEFIMMLVILIAINIGVYFLITNIYRVDPKKYAKENRERLHKIAFVIAVFVSAIMGLIIYNSIIGAMNFKMGLVFAGVGVLFAFLGNYMPNLKPNYFAGLRLPWTLEDPDNWKKTHQYAGKFWFAGGLLLAVVCPFLNSLAAMIFFFTIMAVIVLVPCVYSYRIYKEKKLSHQQGQ